MNSQDTRPLLSALFAIACCLVFEPLAVIADPGPGDIFKEFVYDQSISVNRNWRRFIERDSTTVDLTIGDLADAVRAEIAVYFGTGHIGTSDQSVRVNNGAKRALPQPDTPGDPYCYFRKIKGRPALELPLSELREGVNRVTFFIAEQVCHGFRWPGYNVESFLIRVYYGDSKPHPEGKIFRPADGSVLGERVEIETVIQDHGRPVTSVELVGLFEGYPFEGSGRFLDWHHGIDETGKWCEIIGRTNKAPHRFEWDLSWIPDQSGPMKLMARLTDDRGVSAMTAAVSGLVLDRSSRSVKMYRAYDVPENFRVRISRTLECPLEPVAGDLHRAVSARLVSTIFVGHMEGRFSTRIGLNGLLLHSYYKLSDYQPPFYYPRQLPVPLGVVQQGINRFFIQSDTEGHMSEVFWPAPALLVEYDLTRPQTGESPDRPTYPDYTGPRFDSEYFRTSASDSIVFLGDERAHLLCADQAGDYIEFTVYVRRTGHHEIKLGYLRAANHGRCRLYFNGEALGPEVDQYMQIEGGYHVPDEVDLGEVLIEQPGDVKIRLEVSGKNDASAGFRIGVTQFFIKRKHGG